MKKYLFVEIDYDENPGAVYRSQVARLVSAVTKTDWAYKIPNLMDYAVPAMQLASAIELQFIGHANSGDFSYEFSRQDDLAFFRVAYGKLLEAVLSEFVGNDQKIIFIFNKPSPAVRRLLELIDPEEHRIGIMVERNDGKTEYDNDNQVGEMARGDIIRFMDDMARITLDEKQHEQDRFLASMGI
jgi:hypothetical protein